MKRTFSQLADFSVKCASVNKRTPNNELCVEKNYLGHRRGEVHSLFSLSHTHTVEDALVCLAQMCVLGACSAGCPLLLSSALISMIGERGMGRNTGRDGADEAIHPAV